MWLFQDNTMRQAQVRGRYVLAVKEIRIDITDDGLCSAVWDDSNPLKELGDIEVTRLSDIEFDHESQGWKVYFRNGTTLLETFQQRQDALDAEVKYVDEHFRKFVDWVKYHSKEVST
jgi:hypothetical protein